ncbi:MAG TPA: BON domain-containing protein [Polyangiaceae bacterium]
MSCRLRSNARSALTVLAVFAAAACGRRTISPAPESRPVASSWPPQAVRADARASDEDLQQAVLNELHKDKNINEASVLVTATGGSVVLTGKVDNPLSRERATRIAQVVRGVRSVDNRIDVAAVPRADSDIAADVRKALKGQAATGKMPISVQVKDAVVTLSGTVSSRQEQRLAERVAEGVRGVRLEHDDLLTGLNSVRSAAEIQNDVTSRLAWDALVEHDPITVSVKARQVYLSGTTGSAAECARAISDAWVDGVKGVEATELLVDTVQRPDANVRAAEPRADRDIARAILDAAHYEPRLHGASFTPSVTDSVVTLNGSVDTLSARMAAAALARSTVGVRAVKNQLAVTPPLPLEDHVQQKQISDALSFDPLLIAGEITPTVKNGRVTLSGNVDTYFERAEALDDVSGIGNVTAIDDKLTVRKPAQSYVYSPWIDPFTPHVDTWYVTSLRASLSDSEITKRIRENFKWSAFVQPQDVGVRVERGEATLTGRVSSYRERQAVIDGALEAGAISVDDELSVG